MDKFVTKSFKETQNVGAEFAGQILHRAPQKNAVVLALSGDLGSGKTTFLQGFAKGLGIKEIVNSPTFVIMKKFAVLQNVKLYKSQYKYFYHFDLYRLENEKDVEFLNLQEIISDPKNIVAIEWPEKIADILPKDITTIRFKHLEENKREIEFDF